MLKLASQDDFTARIDVIAKAIDGDDARYIHGLATFDAQDVEGETVLPEGLDLSYLKKHGVITSGHTGSLSKELGVITDYKVGPVRRIVPRKYWHKLTVPLDAPGVWITGRLHKGAGEADMRINRRFVAIPPTLIYASSLR